MKIYVLTYEWESWTEQGKEIVGIYLTKEKAYASMLLESVNRGWKNNGDDRYYKVTDTYITYRQDWDITRTLQIEEYEAKD